MRPTIIEWLQSHGPAVAVSLVPTAAVVYSIAIAVLVVLFLARLRPHGIGARRGLDAALSAGFGGLVGAHLFLVIERGNLLRVSPLAWLTGSTGTASWGAYLGALAGLALYLRATRQAPWRYLDTAASCTALGPAIGRFACLLAGDDFGRPSGLPWAIAFPPGSLPFNAHVDAGLIAPTATASLPVHPLQLLLAANGLVVFLVVSAVWRRARDRPRVTLGTYLVLYGATRFPWEFLRDPAAGGAAGRLSTSQVMCALFVATGATLLAAVARKSVGASSAARGSLATNGAE